MRISCGLLIAACAAAVALSQSAGAAGSTSPAPAAAPGTNAAPPPSQADQDVDFYALGLLLSRNLDAFSPSDHEFEQVLQGFTDAYHKNPRITDLQPYIQRLQALQGARQQVVAQKQKEAGAAYLSKAAALPGAKKTASGLVYVPSVEGSGAVPHVTDRVKVNYEGKLVDGTVFDSSIKRGEPATFPLGSIVPCWKEALQLMKVGGKARVICPANLAYGDRGAPGVIPPGATLDFQIELLDVLPPQAPQMPKAPATTAPKGSAASEPAPAAAPGTPPPH
jgi:FKBP-type peptidyl-prolyl cis-trans isomerase